MSKRIEGELTTAGSLPHEEVITMQGYSYTENRLDALNQLSKAIGFTALQDTPDTEEEKELTS